LVTKQCQGSLEAYQYRPDQARPIPLGLGCTAC